MVVNYIDLTDVMYTLRSLSRHDKRVVIATVGKELNIVFPTFNHPPITDSKLILMCRIVSPGLHKKLTKIFKSDVLVIDDLIIQTRGIIYVSK